MGSFKLYTNKTVSELQPASFQLAKHSFIISFWICMHCTCCTLKSIARRNADELSNQNLHSSYTFDPTKINFSSNLCLEFEIYFLFRRKIKLLSRHAFLALWWCVRNIDKIIIKIYFRMVDIRIRISRERYQKCLK